MAESPVRPALGLPGGPETVPSAWRVKSPKAPIFFFAVGITWLRRMNLVSDTRSSLETQQLLRMLTWRNVSGKLVPAFVCLLRVRGQVKCSIQACGRMSGGTEIPWKGNKKMGRRNALAYYA